MRPKQYTILRDYNLQCTNYKSLKILHCDAITWNIYILMSHQDSLTREPIEMKPCDDLRFTCITCLFQALPCAICVSHCDTNQSRQITSTSFLEKKKLPLEVIFSTNTPPIT